MTDVLEKRNLCDDCGGLTGGTQPGGIHPRGEREQLKQLIDSGSLESPDQNRNRGSEKEWSMVVIELAYTRMV